LHACSTALQGQKFKNKNIEFLRGKNIVLFCSLRSNVIMVNCEYNLILCISLKSLKKTKISFKILAKIVIIVDK